MRRRALLGWLASIPGLRVWAQTAGFPGAQADVLRALAGVVLPAEIGAAGIERIATGFEGWVREYRPGADMDHGYGFTRLRVKAASPAPVYLQQLERMRPALLGGDAESRRRAVETELEEAKITALPMTPDGKHVASDLMAFFFRSGEANDLCYRAEIRRYDCRGLQGSDKPPAPLKEKA